MPLNATALGAAIEAKLVSYFPEAPTGDIAQSITDFSDDLADVIVNHIKNNLTVTVPIASFVTAVTPPAGGVVNPAPVTCGVA